MVVDGTYVQKEYWWVGTTMVGDNSFHRAFLGWQKAKTSTALLRTSMNNSLKET
jgi:hypothetical protein